MLKYYHVESHKYPHWFQEDFDDPDNLNVMISMRSFDLTHILIEHFDGELAGWSLDKHMDLHGVHDDWYYVKHPPHLFIRFVRLEDAMRFKMLV